MATQPVSVVTSDWGEIPSILSKGSEGAGTIQGNRGRWVVGVGTGPVFPQYVTSLSHSGPGTGETSRSGSLSSSILKENSSDTSSEQKTNKHRISFLRKIQLIGWKCHKTTGQLECARLQTLSRCHPAWEPGSGNRNVSPSVPVLAGPRKAAGLQPVAPLYCQHCTGPRRMEMEFGKIHTSSFENGWEWPPPVGSNTLSISPMRAGLACFY